MKNKKTKKYHSLRNASILFGIIFTTIGLMATAFFGPRDEGLTAVSLLLTMLSLLMKHITSVKRMESMQKL